MNNTFPAPVPPAIPRIIGLVIALFIKVVIYFRTRIKTLNQRLLQLSLLGNYLFLCESFSFFVSLLNVRNDEMIQDIRTYVYLILYVRKYISVVIGTYDVQAEFRCYFFDIESRESRETILRLISFPRKSKNRTDPNIKLRHGQPTGNPTKVIYHRTSTVLNILFQAKTTE